MMEIEFKISKLAITIFTLNEMVVSLIKEEGCRIYNNIYGDRSAYNDFIKACNGINLVNEAIRFGIKADEYDDRSSKRVLSAFINLDKYYSDLSKGFISLYRNSKDWRDRLDYNERDVQIIFKCDFKKGILKKKDIMFLNDYLLKIDIFKFEFLPEDSNYPCENP